MQKILKKYIPALLLAFTMLYGICGYFVVYVSMQYYVKQSVAGKILTYIPAEELSVFKVAQNKNVPNGQQNFRLINEGEIQFAGNMYDVAYTAVQNDTLYYYCIQDFDEQFLMSNLDAAIGFFISEDADTQQKQHKLMQHVQKEYFTVEATETTVFSIFHRLYFSAGSEKCISAELASPTPPPKQV